MGQITLLLNVPEAKGEQDGSTGAVTQGNGHSPAFINDGAIHCKECDRVTHGSRILPVDEEAIVNAFLNPDPESTTDYLDLETGDIISLTEEDDSEWEELEEWVSRSAERYLFLEPLTPVEFSSLVSEFIRKLPDSIPKDMLRRALEADEVIFPSEVEALLAPFPDVLRPWSSFRARRVFKFAEEQVRAYTGVEISPMMSSS